MLRPSPNHGTQWLPNDDDEEMKTHIFQSCWSRVQSSTSPNCATTQVLTKQLSNRLHHRTNHSQSLLKVHWPSLVIVEHFRV